MGFWGSFTFGTKALVSSFSSTGVSCYPCALHKVSIRYSLTWNKRYGLEFFIPIIGDLYRLSCHRFVSCSGSLQISVLPNLFDIVFHERVHDVEEVCAIRKSSFRKLWREKLKTLTITKLFVARLERSQFRWLLTVRTRVLICLKIFKEKFDSIQMFINFSLEVPRFLFETY